MHVPSDQGEGRPAESVKRVWAKPNDGKQQAQAQVLAKIAAAI
jgi:hypothetical protein